MIVMINDQAYSSSSSRASPLYMQIECEYFPNLLRFIFLVWQKAFTSSLFIAVF